MKDQIVGFIAFLFMCFIVVFWLWGSKAYTPHMYEGMVVDKIEDNLVIEIVVPATADELIGLEVGDEYVIQGVHR
jgi:hypothetical protein